MSWKAWRPVIWLVLIAVALGALVNVYLGVLVAGAAIGVGARVARRRPQPAQPGP